MESIGKYQIVEKIGEGGFGVIYKGYDPFIKRPVAVKTCTSDAEDIRSRFFHEAQIAGNLQHRNITTIYDFGVVDGVPYLVQEYLSGEDLDRKIKRKEFIPYPEKLLYLVQIARGLELAHVRGVIHRDIKPANIRILEDGTAKIMDFGIAKLAQQESGLTQTGMTLGTAAYLAPEQIRGESVDQRTDIFSYGLLAYELLTYVRPFSGQQISTLLFQILNEEPRPLAERWPGCPPELAAIVGRCMEKDAGRRYSAMTEVLRDLETLLKRRRALEDRDPVDSGAVPSPDTNPVAIAEMATTALAQASRAALPTAAGAVGGAAGPLTRPPFPQAPQAQQAGDAAGNGAKSSSHFATASERTRSQPITDIGDVELAYHIDEQRKTPRSITTTAYVRRESQARPLLLALVGVGLALLAGGFWWMRSGNSTAPAGQLATAPGDGPPPAGSSPSPAAANPGNAATTGAGAPATATPSPPNPGPAASAPGPTGSSAAAGPVGAAQAAAGGADPLTTPTTAPPAVAAEPPPVDPPPPAKATLEIAPSWSDQVVLHGLGRPLPLGTRKQSLELEAGSYRLTFELLSEDYNDVQELRLTLEPGKTRRIQVPIQPPGRISVLPFPDTPQGRVSRGGEVLGTTPLLDRPIRPGTHMLEVSPLGSTGVPVVVPQVVIRSGETTSVSVDLTGRRKTSIFPVPPAGGEATP